MKGSDNMKNSCTNFEFLNKDYLELAESKEYQLGRRITTATKLLKKGKLLTLTKRTFNFIRSRKYSNHPTKSLNITNKIDFKNKKIAVYTCMVGDYDYIRKPKYISDNCDYFLITDTDTKYNVYQKKKISKEIKRQYNNNPILINRYFKMHPFEIFENYDYAIYVDSNVEIISDIAKLVKGINEDYGLALHASSNMNSIYDEIKLYNILKKGNYKKMKDQAARYKKEKFPDKYGMLDCNVIVYDLKNLNAIKITSDWWIEYLKSESLRDKLSLPYVLWKNDVPVIELTGLGSNIYKNPIVRVNKKHKNK